MSPSTREGLVEERVAQLETISQRRNELLREMYHMMRRRRDIGLVLALDDEQEDDLPEFLEKFDLRKNPETGSIANLVECDLFAPPSPAPQSPREVSPPPSSRGSPSPKVERLPTPTTRGATPHAAQTDAHVSKSRSASPVVASRSHTPMAVDEEASVTEHSDRESDDDLSFPQSQDDAAPSRASSHSLPPQPEMPQVDEDEDEPDELDILGTPASPPKSELPTAPRSRSPSAVIEIAGSPDAQEVAETDELPVLAEEEAHMEEEEGADMEEEEGAGAVEVGEDMATGAVPIVSSEEPVPASVEVQEDEPLETAEVPEIEAEAVAMDVDAPKSPLDEGQSDSGDDEEPPAPAHVADQPAIDAVASEAVAEAEVEDIVMDDSQIRSSPAELPQTEPSTQETQQTEEESQPEQPASPLILLLPDEPPVEAEVGDLLFPESPAMALPIHSPKPFTPTASSFAPAAITEVHRPPVIIKAPLSPLHDLPHYNFEPTPPEPPSAPRAISPVHLQYYSPQYTLPPLKSLPPEFNRKGKPTKQQRKREKEREKNERGSEKGDARKDKDVVKDDWVPMGLNKWGATVRANPVWKRVSRATKCVSTRDWSVAMTELRLIRTLDRVELLKDGGRWSFRQPKKQRGVGGLMKTHWDYLMDEMKWMRIDFREERKWKLALAYNLSTAVLEWHAAGSLAERVGRGICVLWKRPRVEEREEDAIMADADADADVADEPAAAERVSSEPPKNSLLMVDYGSDDDDDDDAEKEQQSVVDALETAAMIEDALVVGEREDGLKDTGEQAIMPKTEDIEDASALNPGADMDVDSQDPARGDSAYKAEEAAADGMVLGLKPTSTDPLLGSNSNSQSSNGDGDPPPKASAKSSLYAPLREKIAYFDDQKLFLDIEDLVLPKDTSAPLDDVDVESLFPVPDLATIFPDLQPLGLLDVATGNKKKPEKRSDKDDPNKRAEDTTYTKLTPIGTFMRSKPTLLGSLQPSRRWKNGKWTNLEEGVVIGDWDATSGRITEENFCDIFEGNRPNILPSMNSSLHMPPPTKDARRKVDHLWSANDDALLKSLCDKYLNNWALISECFNASRVTIVTDKRSPWDCQERWNAKWGVGSRAGPHATPSDPATPAAPESVPPTPGQMTTRGVKRLASVSVSAPSAVAAGTASGSEPKKRRRHMLMQETIRKAAKKREANLKSNSQRKQTAIHDTHTQYNKMPKMTPAELSRMKADKEMRDSQEAAIARRRQEEITRQQQQLREQASRMHLPQNAQQLQQQQQQQQQQQGANGVPRPASNGLAQVQQVPQIRSQVNISQQQRIPTPMSAANARMSPQTVLQAHQARTLQNSQQVQAAQAQVQAAQAQAQAAQAQAQAQGQPQTQVQVQAQHPVQSMNGVASAINGAHLSPPFASRDATSSPAQASPPRNSATPSNAGNPPRPPSAQPPSGALQIPGNAMPRVPSNIAQYFTLPHTQTGQYTTEQLNRAIRAQGAYQAAAHLSQSQGSYTQQP